MEFNEEQMTTFEAIMAMVKHKYERRNKWNCVLVKLAKTAFETLFCVKPGDMMEMCFITPEKVIYDDVCMDKYGNLKVRCYHLKKDGTSRKNASLERWGNFYINEIKYRPDKDSDGHWTARDENPNE